MQFIELDGQNTMHSAGYAPFLDYRPLTEEEQALVPQLRDIPWLKSDLEEQARTYAITELVPRHFEEVQNWQKARERAGELYGRLERRTRELEQERQLSPLPPIVVGGVLVIPAGLMSKFNGQIQNDEETAEQFARETARIEYLAMEAVMQAERQLGYIPRDVSAEKCGFDIESKMPGTGKLRFIEVKGRVKDSTTVIITKNEVLTALNKSESDIEKEDNTNINLKIINASTGWETMLEGLIKAGFTITGTWPMRTELIGNLKKNVGALASSIVLVCRPRPVDAPIASRREFLNALRSELPNALKNLQHGSIAPVDLAQASIGPGMAIYSRYSKVIESDGTPLSVRTALQLINRILDEVLAEQEGEYDAETRWAIAWFEEYAKRPFKNRC